MTTSSVRVYSDLPIPPGEVLEEELEARGMTQKELAARLGRPAQAINEIIRAKKAITPDTAIGLGKVLGIDARFWTSLETDYRMALARRREQDMLADNVQWLTITRSRTCSREVGYRPGRDRPSRLKALMSFLGVAVAEPQAFQKAVGFRITEAAQQRVSLGALAAWLRKGELDAQKVSTADYDEDAFTEALSRIRSMTAQPPDELYRQCRLSAREQGLHSAWYRNSRRAALTVPPGGCPTERR